jgi:hypothetical protein
MNMTDMTWKFEGGYLWDLSNAQFVALSYYPKPIFAESVGRR